jgi:hypothetical protein
VMGTARGHACFSARAEVRRQWSGTTSRRSSGMSGGAKGIPHSTKGTYLNPADAGGLIGESAKLRLYGWTDRRRKVFSGGGVLIWLPGLVGLLLVVAGVVFLSAKAPIDPAAVARAANDLEVWDINPPSSAPASPSARIALTDMCLDGLAGQHIPAGVRVDGIECNRSQPSWIENKDHAPVVATIGGAIAAVLALGTAARGLRFGHAP